MGRGGAQNFMTPALKGAAWPTTAAKIETANLTIVMKTVASRRSLQNAQRDTESYLLQRNTQGH